MTEVFSWTVIASSALAAAAVSMLTLQTEHETRAALEAGVRKVMARLQERYGALSGRSIARRKASRKPGSTHKRAVAAFERRGHPRRRLEDLFPSLRKRRSGI